MFEKNTSDMQWFCFKIRHLIKLKLLFLHILCNVVETITRDIIDLIKLISSVANKLGKIWGFHFKVCWWRHQPVWHQNPWFEPFQVEILWQRKAKVQTITATYIKLTIGYSKASLIFVARINWTVQIKRRFISSCRLTNSVVISSNNIYFLLGKFSTFFTAAMM